MRQKNELFTTNYGVQYDNWLKVDLPVEGQFRDVYIWCNYYIYTWTSNYYLLVQIVDVNNKIVYEGYINTIPQYLKIRNKLKKCTKCTEKDWVYLVGNNEEYLLDNNDNYLIP